MTLPSVEPSTKRSLLEVLGNKKVAPAKKKARKNVNEAEILTKNVNKVKRAIQGQINAKLKWKNSFRRIKGTGVKKGGRCEVVCNDPKVFEEIFGADNIKKTKDKLSCSFKEDDEVYSLPFHGKEYRYDSAELRAPVTASLKDNALTFSFKFSI